MKYTEGYNNHHLNWERRSYTTSVEKAFKNHPAMVFLMDIQVHKELHEALPPPPKLSKQQMLGALSILSTLDYKENQMNTIDNIAWRFSTDGDDVGRKYGKHLFKQLEYLERGKYDITR